jgi:two-component system CheB/CheR fusion protein
LQLFAFSLRDGGYLVLGKSETPEPLAKFFAPAHPQLKIYRRQGDRMLIPAARIKDTTPLRFGHSLAGTGRRAQGRPVAEPAREALRSALLPALPWGVLVVDRHYDIQTINPAARRLLCIHGPGLGEDLLHLTEHLRVPGLRAAIDAVRRGAAERDLLLAVETAQGEQRYLQLLCRPPTLAGEAAEQGPAPAEGTVLILVADVTALEGARRAQGETLARVQEEQARLEERLHWTVELNRELEVANEQLNAANAELRGANEEFLVGSEETQAAMEEVETLNEELQATNEELETVNEELQATVEELHTTNDDLQARNLEMQALAAEREEQRQRSEAERARLAAVLLSMGDAVLVVDRTGAVVLTNAAVARLLGPTGADVVPQDADGQPLPAEQTPRARAARGETFSLTFTLPGADGTRRWFEAMGQPIQSAGADQGGLVVIRDITDRSVRRMQEEFLALVSHELRTPLTPIRGYLTLLSQLLQTESSDGRARRYLARVQEQMQRLQRLVDDLLDVERLQEGKLQLDREAVDLVPLVQGLVEALHATTDGPRVELAVAEEPLVVAGDATRLSQVVLNLLTNAAKYAPDSPRIELRLRREAGEATLEVQDYGPGIPAAALPHLFDRFYQAGRRPAQDGLGVGLFITRELVRAHGGAIEVRSSEGAGATFTVRLPLLAAPEQAAPTSLPDAPTSMLDAKEPS